MNLIEIFKAGTRKDANGKEVTLTIEDLQQAVQSYNVEFHEAPAVIGHPQHNHPAYAWVKRLELDGDILKAEFDQIDPEFAEMVDKGRFKKYLLRFTLQTVKLILNKARFIYVTSVLGGNAACCQKDCVTLNLLKMKKVWWIFLTGQKPHCGDVCVTGLLVSTDRRRRIKVLPDYLVGSVQEEAVRNSYNRKSGISDF